MPKIKDPIAAWAESSGVRLASPLDGGGDVESLAWLDAAIAGADLVFLGETDHFVHEKLDFRLLLCRYLMSRGWASFAEELAWSDGERIARFLNGGGEAELQRLSLFGWLGDLRSDRDDRPTGILAASFKAYPTQLMAAEQGRFYRGLRHAANGRSLAYHGFDIDGLPGGGYADIAERLAPHAALPGVATLLAGLARHPGETAAEEAARLFQLAPAASALAGEIGRVALEVEVAVRAMADSLSYVARTYPATTYQALAPGMAFREGCMKRRFADLRRLLDEAPTVVMAHAFHLAKDDRLLGKPVGIGPGGGLECSMGHHLVQELGLKAVSIWMVHGSGEDSQPFPDLPRKLRYPKASLNARLSAIETPLCFPVAGAPAGLFDAPIGVGHMYGAVQPAVLAGQLDAIVYFPRVTPMRSPN